MEKNYMLRLNDNYLYFKKLESVKDFFIKCGVKKNLIDEDEEVYSLNKLEDILEISLRIENECMCERGDEYCDLYLGIITFED